MMGKRRAVAWRLCYNISFESRIRNHRNCATVTSDLGSGLVTYSEVHEVFLRKADCLAANKED